MTSTGGGHLRVASRVHRAGTQGSASVALVRLGRLTSRNRSKSYARSPTGRAYKAHLTISLELQERMVAPRLPLLGWREPKGLRGATIRWARSDRSPRHKGYPPPARRGAGVTTRSTLGLSPTTSTAFRASCESDGHRQLPRAIGTAGGRGGRHRDGRAGAVCRSPQREGGRAVSGPDPVAALAAERVADLRRQIDYLASTVALVPASPRRAAARSAVAAIDGDVAELLRHLGVDVPPSRPPNR